MFQPSVSHTNILRAFKLHNLTLKPRKQDLFAAQISLHFTEQKKFYIFKLSIKQTSTQFNIYAVQ